MVQAATLRCNVAAETVVIMTSERNCGEEDVRRNQAHHHPLYHKIIDTTSISTFHTESSRAFLYYMSTIFSTYTHSRQGLSTPRYGMNLPTHQPYLSFRPADLSKAQTPQQRKANERYARQEAAKRGKPESAAKQKQKWEPPISRVWIGMCWGEHV